VVFLNEYTDNTVEKARKGNSIGIHLFLFKHFNNLRQALQALMSLRQNNHRNKELNRRSLTKLD
jgi:hypothetical protein